MDEIQKLKSEIARLQSFVWSLDGAFIVRAVERIEANDIAPRVRCRCGDPDCAGVHTP